ncbi:helix-turn-helix transcriptional regulator [Edwardsiella anguillarum]|uniref:helix-turn-helix transcriptional regulator n=1 Tax=Edwardsiella anguillarum TaxID=1821960 RepID=UPI0024B64C71|nr:LuxR C-terminal-related transcriptional regulator [Edwardsiella anguillarum]WHP79731.1 LuxR C-terminal-related transcriptional regulator [Edwardsiella anguillarum]WHQ17191.1 LuxR C-terminal-related transcriptional regulator [Edwardsiella anguillarum]WHQ20727.1 LuxR C-terminal-related transcriptional regulator [Edwardsiella anguillarum]WHQ24248.1 LuxR C-terminal-related transcriptional regulator [Edwardsiella anguillarum]WHQ27818.1 LuxR C-terminal-related transcriptional regulator [Edwardsie
MRPAISPQASPDRPHCVYIVAPCPFFAQGLSALLAPYLEIHLLPSLQALSHDRQDTGPARAIVCTGTLNSQRLGELSQLVARLRRRHPAGLQLLAVLDARHPGLERLLLAMGFDAVWHDRLNLTQWLLHLAHWLDIRPTAGRIAVRPYLTERELRVLKWSAEGASLPTMAQQHGVSVKSLYSQRRSALHKLGLTRTREWLQLSASLLRTPPFAIKRRRTPPA